MTTQARVFNKSRKLFDYCSHPNSVIAYGTGSALEGGVIPQNENTCTIVWLSK